MPTTTLITPADLLPHLGDPEWAIFDCRFTLSDEERGERDYRQAHIPGAVYAHVSRDLAGPVVPGLTGRHPLHALYAFVDRLSRWGVDAGVQVVVYDDSGGAMAARLWWMLHWLGHPAVAVLDGGWPAWQAAGYPVASGTETRPARVFVPHPRPELALDAAQVEAIRTDPRYRLFDARAADRYRGENETIDPIAGHIPGAVSAPYAANLDAAGRFLPAAALRARFARLLGDVPAERSVFYCGSGVTAAQDVLALAAAGLGEGRLYPGSWSDWITDPARPIATGEE
jgi:thiosulfate/3-mercaptopyruvate sulfurtransferase